MGIRFSLDLPDIIVITGTASGLGLELAEVLVSKGAQVIGVDLASIPQELTGKKLYSHVNGDVSNEATWTEVVQRVETSGANSIGLATCAAILDVGDILDTTEKDWAKAFQVNVFGTVAAIKALLPIMDRQRRGSIVVVGSVDSTFAEQQLVAYCASKGATRQLARTVALDHARRGVRANVLSPGPMLAGLFKRHMDSASDRERFISIRANRQPYGRILEAREVAEAAIFLLSDQAGAINGAELMADGGLTTGFDFRTGEEGASIK
jgi:NAD(P)-dependent dehydrogenase (short-subunit alcohol dehydrogenase family)